MTPRLFIGIDLAWSDKNPSAVAVLADGFPRPTLVACLLITPLEEIVGEILGYAEDTALTVGVDAPLKVPNRTGNRETEKAFLRDFARYRIGMLPVNRNILETMFGSLRGERLLERLEAEGFSMGTEAGRGIAEVYPHSTIAVCFNQNRLLPYKRKKGRSVADIKAALSRYQAYLREAVGEHPLFDTDIALLKGRALKEYEDRLDGVASAYALWYCHRFPTRCKTYTPEGEGVFVTPFPGE